MDLVKLKDKQTEIIKAEIGSLLFNLGKTHIGFWNNYFNIDKEGFKTEYGYEDFSKYLNYYKKDAFTSKGAFRKDLERTNNELVKFFYDTEINLSDLSEEIRDLKLANIMYGKAIKSVDRGTKNFVLKIFFNGCENINSGIDKGTPPDEQQLDLLQITNAFGSYKERVTEDRFDMQRQCFFYQLWDKIKTMPRKPEEFIYEDWIEIKGFIFSKIKGWYSHLLSDSRYPANDVTLWEQVYMTSSLFKATLAAMILDTNKYKNYEEKPRTIKWSILGIQYDKLGLAEKALKAHYISWYREATKKADEKIKEIIEIEYVLGNEIYRDETGIYFVVPENIGEQSIHDNSEDGGGYLLNLHGDLDEIKNKVIEVFYEAFKNEIYPAILVTKPARGIMNSTHLLEKSRENFLRSVYSERFAEICNNIQATENEKIKYQGLCQICRLGLGKKNDKGLILCTNCEEREGKRFGDWVEMGDGETIWSGELQDSNGRIAFVTIKFELDEWLNGNLLNTTLNTRKDYNEKLDLLKRTLITIRNIKKIDGDRLESYEQLKNDENKLIDFIQKVDGVIKRNPDVARLLEKEFEIDYGNKKYIGKSKKIKDIKDIPDEKKFENYIKGFRFNIFVELCKGAYKHGVSINDFLIENFLEFFVNTEWQNKVEKELGDKNKIDFKGRKINWSILSDEDVDFFAEILLQFLLCKNPSPARLSRIWETTKEFFVDIKGNIKKIMEIENWRCQRIMWEGANKDDCQEYTFNGLDFYSDQNDNIYLISSIEHAIPAIKKKDINGSKEIANKIEKSDKGWIDDFILKKANTGENSKTKLGNKGVKYKPYLPYLSILDPTPVSWQFIIPAKYVPNVIETIQERYKQNFNYVMGKLPLHIGIIVQDYKKPFYIGLKALRKIRRDIDKWSEIETTAEMNSFLKEQGKCNGFFKKGESIQSYYSLYPLKYSSGKEIGEYPFIVNPKGGKEQLVTAGKKDYKDKNVDIKIYPNTFDFEFLDTNIRRNDIFYKTEEIADFPNYKGKRYLKEKQERPYMWEEWQIFKEFEKYFCKEEDRKTKLNNIINMIYSKLYDWESNDLSTKNFMLSLFINIFDLSAQNGYKNKLRKDEFARLFGVDTWRELTNMMPKEFIRCLWRFIDMYEFWHRALKIV